MSSIYRAQLSGWRKESSDLGFAFNESPYHDDLIEERPLSLYVNNQPFSVFMRTPSDTYEVDLDLAAGFLWTEGIIDEIDDLARLAPCMDSPDRIHAQLSSGIQLPTKSRRSYLSSSCGLCSFEHVDSITSHAPKVNKIQLTPDHISEILSRFDGVLPLYKQTGGCHGAALYRPNMTIAYIREDVGRHNAVDKVLGTALRSGDNVLSEWILVVSSRAGFEVVQKAVMAGVSAVITLGAASGMAHRYALSKSLALFSFAKTHQAHRH